LQFFVLFLNFLFQQTQIATYLLLILSSYSFILSLEFFNDMVSSINFFHQTLFNFFDFLFCLSKSTYFFSKSLILLLLYLQDLKLLFFLQFFFLQNFYLVIFDFEVILIQLLFFLCNFLFFSLTVLVLLHEVLELFKHLFVLRLYMTLVVVQPRYVVFHALPLSLKHLVVSQ